MIEFANITAEAYAGPSIIIDLYWFAHFWTPGQNSPGFAAVLARKMECFRRHGESTLVQLCTVVELLAGLFVTLLTISRFYPIPVLRKTFYVNVNRTTIFLMSI